MKIDSIENEDVIEFLSDGANAGRIGVFPLANQSEWTLTMVPVALDDRFCVLLGAEVPPELSEAQARASLLTGKNLMTLGTSDNELALGLYDREKNEVYAFTSFFVRHLKPSLALGERHSLVEGIADIIGPLRKEAHRRVEEICNDPDFIERMRAEITDDDVASSSYVPSKILSEAFLAHKAPEDIACRRIVIDGPADDQIPLLRAVDFLRDPDRAVSDLVNETMSDASAQIKRKIIERDAEAAAYSDRLSELENDSNALACRAILDSLDGAFGAEKPNKVWITAARDGMEAAFQYPVSALVDEASDGPMSARINDFHISNSKQKAAAADAFALQWRHIDLRYSDVVDISFRGKSVYRIDAGEHTRRMETREVRVALYAAGDGLRNRLPFASVPYRPIDKIFDDAAPKPDEYALHAEFTAHVGAHSDDQTVLMQAYRQAVHDSNSPAFGDAMVVDGTTVLIGRRADFAKAPFSLPPARDETRPVHEGPSLDSEAHDMAHGTVAANARTSGDPDREATHHGEEER